ncbi:amidohydrolase family protein, partial [Clostridium sp.]|uniref:amidohydrolase family protein n=1 Tax=Clostridium sp. TaxID=1506 RepID=UPI00346499BE
VTYLNKDMEFKTGNIFIKHSSLKIVDGDVDSYCEDIINCEDFIVIPGLFNSHYHSGSNILRGLFKDMTIEDWRNNSYAGDLHSKFFHALNYDLSEIDYKILCIKGYLELMKRGVTFIQDSPFSSRNLSILHDIAKSLGLKSRIDVFDEYDTHIANNDDKIKYLAHLPEEDKINEETLETAKKIKNSLNPPFCTHCLKTTSKRDIISNSSGKSTIELFYENNLLDNKTVLFHCVHTKENDIDILKETGASVVTCPVTALKSGSGAADIKTLLNNNINIALGTDFSFTDIWQVMRISYLLLKPNSPINKFSSKDIMRMATINGAKAFNVHDNLGIIDNGYKADLVFLNKKDPRLYPMINEDNFSNILHNILMEGDSSMIIHVMTDGNWIIKDGKSLLINEDTLNKDYIEILDKISKE